jgi:hypothetical protein
MIAEVAVSQREGTRTPTLFSSPGTAYTASRLGVFVALVMVLLCQLAPQPSGSTIFWALLTIQNVRCLLIVWHRLRLPWFAAGCVSALLGTVAMTLISARGLDLATMTTALPLTEVVLIWSALLFPVLSVGLEALRNSPEWRAWRASTERATLWEMLTLQHVPDARSAFGR